jgi:hypothetical protein
MLPYFKNGVQCLSVVSAQVTCDLKQNQSNLNESEDIENLRCDLIELIDMRRSASRQYVRGVITSDINLLTSKIESLKENVSYKKSTVTQWSEVVASRGKFVPIQGIVSLNLYQSHTTGMKCSTIVTLVNTPTQAQWEVTHWLETVNLSQISLQRQKKKKNLIIGDSHTQGIASEIQLNLDDDFEIQGIVNPVSDVAAPFCIRGYRTNTLAFSGQSFLF